jgi:hypothetical protein
MEFQGKNDAPDALNEILKRYLLERDAATPEGDGLMEMAASSVLSQAPTVTPSAAKEAEMIARLKAQFPEEAVPGPTRVGGALKYGMYALGVVALVSVALLFIFNPFANNDAPAPSDSATEILPADGPGLSGNVPDYAAGTVLENNDLSSLQNGDGNPESNLGSTVEVGTGNGNQGNATRNWVHGAPTQVGSQVYPDSRTSSPFGHMVVIPQPYNVPQTRELDAFPLRELYAQTSTPSGYYQLDPNTDHLIVCSRGTLLHIPKNAFVDATSGEAVTQTVQVELKELYNESDFINSNIATVSNGQQLVSGGAIYVDASAAGRRLRMAKGKDIYVEFATRPEVETQGMQLYHGTPDDRGEIALAPADGRRTKMVALPQENLYYDEFYCNCGADDPWNVQLMQLWHEDFKNTYIATREFRQRLLVLRDMRYDVGALSTYMENTDKPLWKVDQLVANQLLEDAKGSKSRDGDIEYFNQFARQMLDATERFDDHGVDLTRADARKQLMFNHVSNEETDRIMRLSKLRARFIDALEDRLVLEFDGKGRRVKGVRAGRVEKAGTELVAGYAIQQLGWNALSKVSGAELSGGKRREIKVRLTGNIAYESTRAFLAFTKMNSVLPGKPTTGQLHRFARVPENIDAWIVVVGFKNAMPYLGMLRMPKEDGDRIVTVTMEQTRFDEYLTALRSLD